ncbi:MAG TPA: hypothetical protein VF278_04280 [Pirellulales bacterium]
MGGRPFDGGNGATGPGPGGELVNGGGAATGGRLKGLKGGDGAPGRGAGSSSPFWIEAVGGKRATIWDGPVCGAPAETIVGLFAAATAGFGVLAGNCPLAAGAAV